MFAQRLVTHHAAPAERGRARTVHHRERGHEHLPGGREHSRDAAQERRHRGLQRQGLGQEQLPVLQPGAEPQDRGAAAARKQPAAVPGAGRDGGALPAADQHQDGEDAGRRGPFPLAPPGAGPARTRRSSFPWPRRSGSSAPSTTGCSRPPPPRTGAGWMRAFRRSA